MLAPARFPPDQIKRFHTAFITAFNSAEVKEVMAKQGNTISPSTPEAAAQYFRRELTRYAALAEKAGITLD